MGWFGRHGKDDPTVETDDPREALRCALTAGSPGHTALEVTRARALVDVSFPGVRGVVLREPTSAPGAGWTPCPSYRCSATGTLQLHYRAPFLLCPVRNLDLGETVRYDVPVPPEAVVGVLLGSGTEVVWLDDGASVTWLLRSGHTAGLFGWEDQIGTDPSVRIVDVDTTRTPVVLVERETVRLSDLPDEDA